MRLSRLRLTVCALAAMVVGLLANGGAQAGNARSLVSPAGIRFWLSETQATELIALRFAFAGGSASEPDGKNGAARILASLLAEGSNDIDRAAFRRQAQRAGLRIRYQAGRDALYGSIDLPKDSLETAVALAGAALATPRLDETAFEQIKARVVADLTDADSDPRAIATRSWYARAFNTSAYARPPEGAKADVAGVSLADVAAYHAGAIDLDRLTVVVAGAITAEQAAQSIDRMFARLPRPPHAATPSQAYSPTRFVVPLESGSGGAIAFGLPAPPPSHPDHAAAQVAAHILASGDLECRLVGVLRQDLGLAYAAEASLLNDSFASLMIGTVVTGGDKAEAAEIALRKTIAEFAASGPTREEVETAKASLVGSSVLALDATSRLADALLYARLDGEEPDFIERRKRALEAVTLEDVRRVARQVFDGSALSTVIAAGQHR